MKTYILATIFSLLLTIILGFFAIKILRKIKINQPILKYVEEHKEKSGTPTMGGLFFIIPSVIVYFFLGTSTLAFYSILIGLAFMVVGFIDDFIKVKTGKNEGLKPYQKIVFQLSIAVFSALISYKNGLTEFNIPFLGKSVDLGWISVPIIVFIFIATTNSVNLTDGIDGLAGTVSYIYLFFIAIIILNSNSVLILDNERRGLVLLSFSLIGGILGFLAFNFNKAKVFMGDTGSLSLGGFIASISIFSSNSFFIPVIGIMFVMSSISVIVQVFYYKRTKKRVFLMAPLHHHYQMKGVLEGKICFIYGLITVFIGMTCLLTYL